VADTADRFQITPPSGAASGPQAGRSASLHIGGGQLFALFEKSDSSQTLMTSIDSGATWAVDGSSGDWPCPIFNAQCLAWNPSTEELYIFRVVSGIIGWRHRTAAGTWSSLEIMDSSASDSLASILDARIGSDGNGRACYYSAAGGTHHLWYWADGGVETNETIATDGGAYGTSGFGSIAIVLASDDTPHVLFYGVASSARSGLNTIWHSYRTGGAWTTPVAIKTDVSDDHSSVDFRPVMGPSGNLLVPFVAKDGSGVNRLYLAEWTGSWTDYLVDSEWEPRNTNGVVAGVDQDGVCWIATNGEVDSVLLNQAQVYVWKRLPGSSSFTRERVGTENRNVGSSATTVWSSGADVAGSSSLQPLTGAFWFFYGDWDDSTGKYWFVRSPNLTWDTPEPQPVCEAEPTRTSVIFDDEGTSEVTFGYTPDLAFTVRGSFSTNELRTERGYVITHPKQPATRRTWRLLFQHRDQTDRDGILADVETLDAARGTFTFTEPVSGASIVASLVSGSVTSTKVNPGVYTVSFDAVELVNTT